MKASAVMYQPPEDESIVLGIIKGRSLNKARVVALRFLGNEAPDVQVRLDIRKDGRLLAEERYEENGTWTEWMESGCSVYLSNTYTVEE